MCLVHQVRKQGIHSGFENRITTTLAIPVPIETVSVVMAVTNNLNLFTYASKMTTFNTHRGRFQFKRMFQDLGRRILPMEDTRT